MRYKIGRNLGEWVSRQEGFKKTEYDLADPDEIRQEIDEELKDKVVFDYAALSSADKKLRQDIESFVEDLKQKYARAFLDLLNSYQSDSPNQKVLTPPIVEFLKEKHWLAPRVTVSAGKRAEAYLEDFGFDNREVRNGNLLMIMNLPKPLGHFWLLGLDKNNPHGGAKDIKGIVIEWGQFYSKLMENIWDKVGRAENMHNLNFKRINPPGEHDPKKYYYVWEVGRPEKMIEDYE